MHLYMVSPGLFKLGYAKVGLISSILTCKSVHRPNEMKGYHKLHRIPFLKAWKDLLDIFVQFAQQ